MTVGRRAGRSVGVDRIAAALERWPYDPSPTESIALAGFLSETFPEASVERGGRGSEANVVVDGVAIHFLRELGPRGRAAVTGLAASYDGVVCYATNCHRRRPMAWQSFVHRHRNSTVRFVSRPPRAAEPELDRRGAGAAGVVAAIPLLMAAIATILAASLGVFSTDGAGLPAEAWLAVGTIAVLAVVASLGIYGSVRRDRVLSVLRILGQCNRR